MDRPWSSALYSAVCPSSAWTYTIDHRRIPGKGRPTLCVIEPTSETPASTAKDPDLA